MKARPCRFEFAVLPDGSRCLEVIMPNAHIRPSDNAVAIRANIIRVHESQWEELWALLNARLAVRDIAESSK